MKAARLKIYRTFLNFSLTIFGLMCVMAFTAPKADAQELIAKASVGQSKGVSIERWTYTSDGLLVKGELYLPPGKGKLPLVVFNHDGIH